MGQPVTSNDLILHRAVRPRPVAAEALEPADAPHYPVRVVCGSASECSDF